MKMIMWPDADRWEEDVPSVAAALASAASAFLAGSLTSSSDTSILMGGGSVVTAVDTWGTSLDQSTSFGLPSLGIPSNSSLKANVNRLESR